MDFARLIALGTLGSSALALLALVIVALAALRGARPRERVSILLALAVLVGAVMPWRRSPTQARGRPELRDR